MDTVWKVFICFITNRLKYFMMTGVSNMGWWSLRQNTVDCFITGMMVIVLKHSGSTAWLREMLKMSVRTDTLSGPAVFQGF